MSIKEDQINPILISVLKSRSQHTGKQGATTITNFAEAVHGTSRTTGILTTFDDFEGSTLKSRWNIFSGTDGAATDPRIPTTLLEDGQCELITGADAGGTMALNGSQILDDLIYKVNTTNGSAENLILDCVIEVDNTSDICFFVGFTDLVGLEMPIEMAAGDVMVSNASNACGVVYDTAADTNDYFVVGVKNNIDVTAVDLFENPTASQQENIKIRVDNSGDVEVIINNTSEIVNNAVDTSTMLVPTIAVFSRNTTSKTLLCDYILTTKPRKSYDPAP